MSYFGALRRRAPALKTVLLGAGLSLLIVAALSLRSGGRTDGAASQPSVAQSPFATPAPRAVVSEQLSVTGNVVAQGRSVPLPPGQWIVVAHFPAPGPGGMESLFLAQVRRDRLSRAVLVEAGTPAGESARGFPRSAQCTRAGLLYAKTISNEELGRQDCWTVDHDVATGSERDVRPIVRAAVAELERRGVKYPPVLLSAFFRLADRQSFLHAVYAFNPETDGITSRPAPWEASEWNRNHIHQYPDKIAYVEKLRAWAEAWHPAVREGFQGGLPETARKP